ncbi:MAG: sensor histidine kinase [Ilumatobacteraceae bacterium]
MTLRTRLVVAFLLVVTSLFAVAFGVMSFQKSYVNNQTDSRLMRLDAIAESVISQIEGTGSESKVLLDALWEGYIGVFESDGSLTTIKAPNSDPALVPDVDFYSASVEPQTELTRSGVASRVRTKTIALSDGRVALIGLSSAESDDALARLRTTLLFFGIFVFVILSTVAWWIYRLGLRPIKFLTRDADAIASGARRDAVTTGLQTSIETAQLGESFNRALMVTQNAELNMRRFLADVSHELRTPLTSLRGYSSLYLSGGLQTDEMVADAMSRIHAESLRMTQLVNDLLNLNVLEKQGDAPARYFFLRPVLENVQSDVLVANPNRTVEISCANDLVIVGDNDLIFQAILNLVSNAMRHTEPDVSVFVSAQSATDVVTVTVRDTGRGIPAEHLPFLFERFYRVDSGRDSSMGGSGLGLAIVAEIMNIHGGSYGVDSNEDEGTTFWLSFPVK